MRDVLANRLLQLSDALEDATAMRRSAMSRHTLRNDLAFRRFDGGKQGRRSIPLVVALAGFS